MKYTGLTLLLLLSRSAPLPGEELDFDRRIAPLLAQRCLSCHSGAEAKGKLDLSQRQRAMTGGENGPVLVAGKPEESLLWQYVESNEMPPKKPLPEAEKQLLQQWIAAGAKWGGETIDPFKFTTEQRAGYDWWSLQPLRKPEPPPVGEGPELLHPLDRFVQAKLPAAGLKPAAEADRRTLLRRLTFDLLGLPPTPEQMERFLTDESPRAYERLVDELLQSPHYGERWARHWLDVVRFGESNGFEYDQPRDEAWPYRNWVIEALNEDMPYDEFIRWQLAGDLLHPDDPRGVAAVGFLVAGPHNTTLPASQTMRLSMAQDEMEDLVGVIGQSFLGLTVHCARCHDHKFDPVSQQEYYQLAAALAGVTHGERTVNVPYTPDEEQRLADLTRRLTEAQQELQGIEAAVRLAIQEDRRSGESPLPEPPPAWATWEFDENLSDTEGKLSAKAFGGAKLEDGTLVLDGRNSYVATDPLPIPLEEKTLAAWVRLDNLQQRGGAAISLQTADGAIFDAIVFGEQEPKKWMPGSNGFVRTRSLQGPEETAEPEGTVQFTLVYTKDGTITGYRNGLLYGKAYPSGGLQKYAEGKAQILFGLRHSPAGGNRLLSGRIERAQLFDRALTAEEVAATARLSDSNYISEQELQARLAPQEQQRRQQLRQELRELQATRKSLAEDRQRKIYTCVATDPEAGRVYLRGNVTTPGEIVAPAGLRAIPGLSADFQLKPDAGDRDRRVKLAAWITHPDNPLPTRVMVNRVWHYYFGQGLVNTPSDFGFNGGQPSHPELLDWLAATFRDQGSQLKPLHRLIVTSATYRQASTPDAGAMQRDADNRLLWRMSPRRLEAEELRDAMLTVTGLLDRELGGKGYRDVRHYQFRGSNFYEPLADPDVIGRRRTIYRFNPRGGRNPFLDTFDCPDPSATTPSRPSTTTPLQALALLNNAFIFQMAEALAARASREAGEELTPRVARVWLLAYGREASAEELDLGREFVQAQGLPAFCRVVLNSNEFLYVR